MKKQKVVIALKNPIVTIAICIILIFNLSAQENIILEPGVTGGVGIGVSDPDAKLEVNGQIKITGGTPGLDKVLTSDADGLGTWTEAVNIPEVGNYGTVTNPVTGKTWLDRNLGASQVATTYNDPASFGDLYQWGRAQDGHEDRVSSTVSSPATSWLASDNANTWDTKFIRQSNGNWLSTDNDDLWKDCPQINNPCPSGFRIPTNDEWLQEMRTWASQSRAGAFVSVLKLPSAGYRNSSSGNIINPGSEGRYWSSTVIGISSRYTYFIDNAAHIYQFSRASGFSLRCIMD